MVVVTIIWIVIKRNRMLLEKCLLPVLNLLRLIDLFWGAVVVAIIVTSTVILVVPTTVIFAVLVSGVIRSGFVAVVHFKISLSASTDVLVVASDSTSTLTSLMIDTSCRVIAAIADDVVPAAAAAAAVVVVVESIV
jgi:hypothetical protein